jgi:hypothetical protein
MAADDFERVRREMIERTRDAQAGDKIDNALLLREVMNTVGRKDKLGSRSVARIGFDADRGLDKHSDPHTRRPRLRQGRPNARN